MKTIKEILINRDNMTEVEAAQLIKEAKEAFDYYCAFGDIEAAENICQEYFGLEADYLPEIL